MAYSNSSFVRSYTTCKKSCLIYLLNAVLVIGLLLYGYILHLTLLLYEKDTAATEQSYNLDIFKEVVTNTTPSCLIANMPSLEDLEAWSSPLPRPVLNLGFPKAGSTTMHLFFECGGWKSSHQFCSRRRINTCAQCMKDAIFKGLPPVTTCGKRAQRFHTEVEVFTQLDYTSESICYWPQIQALEEIHRDKPNATFILGMRDFDKWFNSVNNWNGYTARIMKFCNFTTSRNKESFKVFYCSQVERVRKFVSDHPSHALIELDIENENAGFIMSKLFDINQTCWGHANKSPLNEQKNHSNSSDEIIYKELSTSHNKTLL